MIYKNNFFGGSEKNWSIPNLHPLWAWSVKMSVNIETRLSFIVDKIYNLSNYINPQ
jgi:hypothetical protein